MATVSSPGSTVPSDTPSRQIVAPYIVQWSEEEDLSSELVERRGVGIAYVDELPTDRDHQGVLWHRVASRPRQGRPEFGDVHPLRQRRAMRRLLCQVCGGPADRAEDGVLWLLQDHRDDWPGWPANMAVSEPPVCLPCVRLSVRLCPALRRGAVAVRVRTYPVVGVRGLLYTSGGLTVVPVEPVMVALDDPLVRWVLARNLLRELHDCTIVPIDELS